jgi:NADPH:quinone reductase-like Zn-dependent oxidoreductase
MVPMRAAVCRRYGPPSVVTLEEMPKPVPGPKEILVRIRASTVSTADWRVRSLEMPYGFGVLARPVFGFLGPRKPVLGTDFAGDVEAVGANVEKFKVGDAVIGFPSVGFGGHAAYRTMAQDGALAHKPDRLSYAQAAALPFGGMAALAFLRDKGKLKAGEHVAIVGASGSVGSAAIQLAKYFGARVTAVCSAANAKMALALGADAAIDYAREDFAAAAGAYDIVLNANAALSFAQVRAALKPGGRLLLVLATLPQMLRAFGADRDGKRQIASVAAERVEDLRFLAALAEAGHFTPFVDREYDLADAAEAHAHVATGRKRGNVVLTMG